MQTARSDTATPAAGIKLLIEHERLGLPLLHRTRADGHLELFALEATDERLTDRPRRSQRRRPRRRPEHVAHPPRARAPRRRLDGRGRGAVAQRHAADGERLRAAAGCATAAASRSARPCSSTAHRSLSPGRRADGHRGRPGRAHRRSRPPSVRCWSSSRARCSPAPRRRPATPRSRPRWSSRPETVKSHLKDLYTRFGLEHVAPAAKRAELAQRAIGLGVVGRADL